MKLFPGSYTPLLIMYLAHKGLLKLVHEFEENDSRILVSVDGKSLHDFFGDGILKELIQDPVVWEQKNMSLQDVINSINRSILKDRDVYVMLPFVDLLPFIVSGKPVALIADVSKDDQISDLIKIIVSSDHSSDTPAALLFFSVMLMKKYEPFAEDDEDTEEKSPEEREEEKAFENELLIEDFEKTLDKIQSYSSEKFWSQPKELSRVILTQYKGGSIYNPFAGLASYATQLLVEVGWPTHCIPSKNIGDHYYGEEISELAWAIGKLRLLAYCADSQNYNVGDSTKWRGGTANNVLCTPPFGLRIENEDGKMEYVESFVIRRGLDMLADDGLLACVVPQSFLYRKDSEKLRKRIVESGWLESIVYLPEKLFENTAIRTAVIFIRKSEHKSVNLVNATDAAYRKNSRLNVLDEEVVANLLCHSSYPSSFIYDSRELMEEELPESEFEKLRIRVANRSIAKSNYDLSPGNYLLDTVSASGGYKLISLRDVVSGIPESVGSEGTGKVIRPALLSKDVYTPLHSTDLLETNYKAHFKVIDQDAILFSPISANHPTLFKCIDGDKAYIDPTQMGAVFLNSQAILPEYVLVELEKPYVREQLQLLSKGNVMPRIMVEDFLQVRIQVPDSRSLALNLEKESYDNAKALHFSKINEELVVLKDKQHSDYVKMLRQRKHRIQQLMNEFAPAFALLDKCRVKNNGILHNDDIVAARTGETVESYFHKMNAIVEKIETLVTNLVDKDHWDAPSSLNIDSYVHKIPSTHISDKYGFQLLFSENGISIEEEGEPILPDGRNVEISENDISTIFDNIIANADKWGFTDETRKDYRIRIEVSDGMIDNRKAAIITISNNGEPIHPSVDRKRFFEWGYGSGTGIGTWQLKDIVEHYGGSIQLNEYPDDVAGFCTEYEIVLPLIINE
jgi:signal transduction histidine kinase